MVTEQDVSINLGRVGSPVTSVTMLVISSTWVAHMNFLYREYPFDKSKKDIWEYTIESAFDLVHDLVDINTTGIGKLAVVAVPTGVQQHPVVLINVQSLSALPHIYRSPPCPLWGRACCCTPGKTGCPQNQDLQREPRPLSLSKWSANKQFTAYLSIHLYNIWLADQSQG